MKPNKQEEERTKKLQELIEEWQEVPMDCSGSPFFRGDKPQRLEFAKAIAQLAEEETLQAKAEQLKVMLGGEFAQALDNWTPEDFIFFIQKPISNQKEDV